MTDFPAILVDKDQDGRQHASLTRLSPADLPDADVTVAVEYSTLNYKDGLVLTGAIPLIQRFPMVPGIDLAGTVMDSRDPRWRPGDRVIANGWGLGERHWGGYAGMARVGGDWLVPCPPSLTARQAMAIGTAGYAAMLCVLALERHGVKPGDGEVLVTGAGGGVGSVAIALLSGLGHRVVASTGRMQEADYLRRLGAAEIIDRAALSAPGAPMQAERWAAAIDTAGSHTLANICASLRYGGVVAATGIAQGVDLPASMLPLVLRNVTLCGVDSVLAPAALRRQAWDRLATDLDTDLLESMVTETTLPDLLSRSGDILSGRIRGRVVVRL
ncbi:MDR family oxidoreductase [Niveispirillum sp. KHB5.9]|uniref:acrylyl-CoA reductase (NADPH) n=1 Tax=Niveispirillum sp. KHB5.9 TaxID=3400269 RepID=UPI003A8B4589